MEVEWKEVSPGDEGGTVAKANDECGDIGAVFEEPKRHDGVDGEFPLIEEEEDDGEEAKDDEAKDDGASPRVRDPTVLEA